MHPPRPNPRDNASGGPGVTASTAFYGGYGTFRGGLDSASGMGSSNTRYPVAPLQNSSGTAGGMKTAGYMVGGVGELCDTSTGLPPLEAGREAPDTSDRLGSASASTASGLLERYPTAATTASGAMHNSNYASSGSLAPRTPGQASAYEMGRLLGNGSFGLVCEAQHWETGEQVAIKKVLQDPRYKNRELDVMKELCHPNVVALKDYFYTESPAASTASNGVSTAAGATTTSGTRTQEIQRFLNVVMEHVPDTVYRVMKSYVRNCEPLPLILVRLYTYQMCRSLGYLHSLGICHRDIKPQNLLVDPRTHVLKLCDFGSAKRLIPSEHSVAYICSRFYRAPELMLGATEYTTAIDIWSIGCVLGELLIGKPLFPGDSSVDQLVKIIQVLGTPTRQQMQTMNPNYTEFRFPDVRPKDWKSVVATASSPVDRGPICPAALDLLAALLKYEPNLRLRPYEALAHPFFDPLRDTGCRLPDGSSLPSLFNFSDAELQAMSAETRSRVTAPWSSGKPPMSPSSGNVVCATPWHGAATTVLQSGNETGLGATAATPPSEVYTTTYSEHPTGMLYTDNVDCTAVSGPGGIDSLYTSLPPSSFNKPAAVGAAPFFPADSSSGPQFVTSAGFYSEEEGAGTLAGARIPTTHTSMFQPFQKKTPPSTAAQTSQRSCWS